MGGEGGRARARGKWQEEVQWNPQSFDSLLSAGFSYEQRWKGGKEERCIERFGQKKNKEAATMNSRITTFILNKNGFRTRKIVVRNSNGDVTRHLRT